MQQLKKLSDDHYIIVDEQIQPVTGYYYDSYIKAIRNTSGAEYGEANHCLQITHSTQPLNTKFNDWFDAKMIDLSYIKSLVGEVDVEKKSEEKYPISMQPKGRTLAGGVYDVDVNYMERLAYKHGYNQCLEDNKHKRFSEEDLKKAFKEGYYGRNFIGFDDFISFLTQPKDTWEIYFDENNNLKLK